MSKPKFQRLKKKVIIKKNVNRWMIPTISPKTKPQAINISLSTYSAKSLKKKKKEKESEWKREIRFKGLWRASSKRSSVPWGAGGFNWRRSKRIFVRGYTRSLRLQMASSLPRGPLTTSLGWLCACQALISIDKGACIYAGRLDFTSRYGCWVNYVEKPTGG